MNVAGQPGHAAARPLADSVAALVAAVAEALARIRGPGRLADGWRPADYLGDVVATAFDGSDRARVELLARLMHLAAAASDPCDPAGPRRWLDRLAGLLHDWDAERRRAVAPPRPRPADLELRVVRLQRAEASRPSLLTEFIALDTAMLTAIHLLAGVTSVERALATVSELTPLLELARSDPRADDDRLGAAYLHPGATLAHLERLAQEWADVVGGPCDEDERPLLTQLPLDVAAALMFVAGARERRWDDAHGWAQVRDRAVEAILTGRLAEAPAAVDATAARDDARSVALTLAGAWLDELRGDAEADADGGALRPLVIDACSRCLVVAWAQRRVELRR
jgi:hypothetical protein